MTTLIMSAKETSRSGAKKSMKYDEFGAKVH